VIIILTTIVAAAIPIMAPADENRRLRETTRGLTAYISGAQTRAIALNRPVGIAFKRLGFDTNPDKLNNPQHVDNGVCLEVFYVEQQPPYAGFDANSRACVALHPNLSGLVLIRCVTRGPSVSGLPPGWVPDLFPTGMIRPGDVMEINGTLFELPDPLSIKGIQRGLVNVFVEKGDNGVGATGYFQARGTEAPTLLARPLNDSGQQIEPEYENRGRSLREAPMDPPSQRPYWTSPATYRILRQPTKTSDEPYQLPEGTAIDLRASGVGSDDYFYVPLLNDNSDDVLVMFAPEGRIERVTYSQMPIDSTENEEFDEPVTDNVYLLVGQRAKIPAPDLDKDATLDIAQVNAATTDAQRQAIRRPLNWLSNDSRWVVIGSQSGRVATIKNAFVELGGIAAQTIPSELKRTDQIRMAREFTRDMLQDEGR
jgi:hypothetical protein